MDASDALLIIPPLIFLYYLYRGKPKPEVLSLFFLSGGLAASMKLLFRIVRESGVDPYAFPSLHSALASSLFFSVPHPLSFAYAVLVMALRVIEGYHSLPDVLAGFLISFVAWGLYTPLKEALGKEIDRKSVHFGLATLAGFFSLFLNPVVLTGIVLFGALLLYLFKAYSAPLFEMYGRKNDYGPLTLSLSLFVSSLFGVTPLTGFVLAYVDTLAFFFGKLFGRHPLPSGKTLEGLLGGTVGGFIVIVLLRGYYDPVFLATASLLSPFVEACSRTDDNVAVGTFVVLLKIASSFLPTNP